MLQNAMRFCDDDAALKRMADEVIRLTAIAAVANADILFADMRLDQTIAAIQANLAALEALTD